MKGSSIIKIRQENISQFSNDVDSLWMKPLETLHCPPTPLQFLREYVNLSTPVLIKNAFPTITLDELIEMNNDISELELNVDVTPDGHGDTIRCVDGEKMFVMPEVRKMNFTYFRDKLRKNSKVKARQNDEFANFNDRDQNGRFTFRSSSSSCDETDEKMRHNDDEIVYYSRQNDCLREELQPLTSYFPKDIPFATEAFDAEPDAINLWIGNESSVSSMHKDHYENIFCVASGQKIFTICPPADAIFIKENLFPTGVFRRDENNGWTVDVQIVNGDEDVDKVRWIEADIERIMEGQSSQSRIEYLAKFPLLEHAHPIQVHVEAGDMLYLPALWYHSVTQSCETVAVNYWYDMRFDSPHWCYFNFLQHFNNEKICQN